MHWWWLPGAFRGAARLGPGRSVATPCGHTGPGQGIRKTSRMGVWAADDMEAPTSFWSALACSPGHAGWRTRRAPAIDPALWTSSCIRPEKIEEPRTAVRRRHRQGDAQYRCGTVRPTTRPGSDRPGRVAGPAEGASGSSDATIPVLAGWAFADFLAEEEDLRAHGRWVRSWLKYRPSWDQWGPQKAADEEPSIRGG